MKIVIVGAGIACVSAIKAIRLYDKYSEIAVYGEEPHYPYKRIRLTKDLADGIQEKNLLIEQQSWYEENRVSIYRDARVERIDPAYHKLILSDGTKVEYTALLLANGASNSVLPIKGIDKKEVFTLRNLRDAKEILEQAGKSQKVLVIGGGILGLEVAWSLVRLGKKVTVVEALPALMPKQLDRTAASILQKIVESHGVVVQTGCQIKEITGDDTVNGFITDQGTHQSCDMVIHSTGIQPNIELVKDSGILTRQGILVDERMQTNFSDIYAAGDVAEYRGLVAGLWSIAAHQGEIAGSNIAGQDRVCEVPVAATVMNAFRFSLFSIGELDDSAADCCISGKEEGDRYQKILFKEGKITGALFMGSIRELPSIRKSMEQKCSFPEVYKRDMQPSEFMTLLKEKQAKKELQPVGAASKAVYR
ncbi:MAG: NAD(P)/FAD-dependent oxidoreductase [Caldicoprobacterales bacterium]|nr:NAD(P)/FAD-dependent oxidoreductase [Clostridiales bacterium]